MLLPFYIVYAQDSFGIGADYIGRYLLFQIAGTVISNLLWGYISDKLNSQAVVRICILGGAVIPLLGGVFINFFGYLITFILVSAVMFSAYYLLKKESYQKRV